MVTPDQMRQWIAEGRVNPQTPVLAEGGTEWKPLANFPEFAEALGIQTGPAPLAGVTGPPVNLAAWTAEILARRPELALGSCLSRAWALVTGNFGLLFGATAVVWLISLCQFVPVVGLIYKLLSGAIYGVLYGGLYLVFLRQIRGQPTAIGEVFDGFKVNFAQLLLAGFISGLLSGIGFCFCLLPGIYLLVAWIFSVPLVADKRLEFWSAMELSRKAVSRVWFQALGLILLAFLPFIMVNLFTAIKIGSTLVPVLQDVMASSQPDIGHLMQTIMQLSATTLLLGMLTKVVLLFNLPLLLGR